jgi:hypothetical protein
MGPTTWRYHDLAAHRHDRFAADREGRLPLMEHEDLVVGMDVWSVAAPTRGLVDDEEGDRYAAVLSFLEETPLKRRSLDDLDPTHAVISSVMRSGLGLD